MQKNNGFIKVLIGINIVLLFLIFIFGAVYIVNSINKDDDTTQTQEQLVQQTSAPVSDEVATTPVSDEKNTIKEFLANALKPVGNTMYVYGGGWNEEDTGAGVEARTIGVSPQWREFCRRQDSSYDSSKYRYHIEKGLDCSGYVGWAVYNTLEDENLKEGYVFLAQEFADKLSALGLGEKTQKEYVTDYKPGDIMSSKSDTHVWIVVGECSDGSIVLLNSSPPGVSICGTVAPDGSTNSEAANIAKHYMSTFYQEWYSNHNIQIKPTAYLTNYDRFRWYTDGRTDMSDDENYYSKTPSQILDELLRS